MNTCSGHCDPWEFGFHRDRGSSRAYSTNTKFQPREESGSYVHADVFEMALSLLDSLPVQDRHVHERYAHFSPSYLNEALEEVSAFGKEESPVGKKERLTTASDATVTKTGNEKRKEESIRP